MTAFLRIFHIIATTNIIKYRATYDITPDFSFHTSTLFTFINFNYALDNTGSMTRICNEHINCKHVF